MALFRERAVVLKALSFFSIGCQEGLYWGIVAATMSPSLIASAFLVHGILSAWCCVAMNRPNVRRFSAESRAIVLGCVAIAGQVLVLAAFRRLGDDEDTATTASPSGALLFLGTLCFGLTDFPAQALLRGAVGEKFEGSPFLEDAMANVIFSLTAGNIAFFVAGPAVKPSRQAAACAGVGLVSVAGLLATWAENSRTPTATRATPDEAAKC